MALRWYIRFLAVFACGIALSHTVAVALLYALGLSDRWAEPVLEPVLVVVFSFPAVYTLAIRPMMRESAGRRRAEHARLASEELLRTVVRASSIGLLAYREGGQCILANPAAARVVGAPPEELLAQDFRRLASWRESGMLEAAQRALSTGEAVQTELRITSTFGKLMWAEYRLVPFRLDGEGHLLVVIDEVSERREREEALRQSEERYRRLIELMPEGILLAGNRGIEFVNPAGLKLLGASALEELRGKPESGLLRPSCPEGACPTAMAGSGPRGLPRTLEKRCTRLDGTTVEVEVTCAPFPLSKALGRIILMRDITEKKTLEKHLLRAQRLENIGTLAAGIAHDLNNILAPISMSAEVLRMKPRDRQEDRLLDTILASARRGADVVRQVLTFARGIEGERVLLQPSYLIEQLEGIVRETFPKNISLCIQAPKELWPVLGDATQLHQVLLNLCINARDAMAHGGQLLLTGANVPVDGPRATVLGELKPGPHVTLSVRDSGHGIPEGIIEKIFDPFFTTKELGRGTGLGLSTVLGIVRSHGGIVEVESRPGHGATFTVLLPAQPAEKAAAAAEPSSLTAGAGQGQTVLVVDDEAHIRTVAERALTLGGYRVLMARDGQEALELVPRHREVQAVVTDILMPRLDGVRLVQSLRKTHARLPVIACTGWEQPRVHQELKNLGVRTILTKPYRSEDLLRELQSELAAVAA